MPELAEVDFFRRQWDPAVGKKVTGLHVNGRSRTFRGVDLAAWQALLGCKLEGSEAMGKQMLFRFSSQIFLGLHLGMTGALKAEPAGHRPGPHDHLVLFQKERALVFTDPRQFGRVRFHQGEGAPEWWQPGPDLLSAAFTPEFMLAFLARHGRLAIKAALLLQDGFPGVGNWMADEILWRAKVSPQRHAGELSLAERRELWRQVRFVARQAMVHISPDFGDPPAGWLFHARWTRAGRCPKHGTVLDRETIGGRTTAWCSHCQR